VCVCVHIFHTWIHIKTCAFSTHPTANKSIKHSSRSSPGFWKEGKMVVCVSLFQELKMTFRKMRVWGDPIGFKWDIHMQYDAMHNTHTHTNVWKCKRNDYYSMVSCYSPCFFLKQGTWFTVLKHKEENAREKTTRHRPFRHHRRRRRRRFWWCSMNTHTRNPRVSNWKRLFSLSAVSIWNPRTGVEGGGGILFLSRWTWNGSRLSPPVHADRKRDSPPFASPSLPFPISFKVH